MVLLLHCEGQNSVPPHKDVHILISGTCEYVVTLDSKEELILQMKLRLLII